MDEQRKSAARPLSQEELTSTIAKETVAKHDEDTLPVLIEGSRAWESRPELPPCRFAPVELLSLSIAVRSSREW